MDEAFQNNEHHLATWLVEVKKLILAIAKRSRVLQELCPFSDFGEPNRTTSLKALATVNSEIEEHCEHLRKVERESDYHIGCGVLLGSRVESSRPLYIATALLIAARLHKGFRSECRSVAEVVDLSTGGCPVSIIRVRDAFRAPEGTLLGWLHFSRERTLDQCNIDLTDSALARVCGRMPTEIEDAHAALGYMETTFRSRR